MTNKLLTFMLQNGIMLFVTYVTQLAEVSELADEQD